MKQIIVQPDNISFTESNKQELLRAISMNAGSAKVQIYKNCLLN